MVYYGIFIFDVIITTIIYNNNYGYIHIVDIFIKDLLKIFNGDVTVTEAIAPTAI